MRILSAFVTTARETLRPVLSLPVAWLCLGMALLALALSLAGIAIAPYRIVHNDLGQFVWELPGLAGMFVLLILFIVRLSDDASWSARNLTRLCRTVADTCPLWIMAIVFLQSCQLLQAFSACVGFPFQDAAFAAADRGLGLHWEGIVAALNASPLVVSVLIASYFSVVVTLPVLIVAMLIRGDREGLWELFALLMLGALFTLVGATFVPAVGAYTYYAPDPASTSQFVRQWPEAGTYFVSGLLKIHGGHLDELDLSQINGIVQFPSFHGIMAMVLGYMARSYRLLAAPFLVVNLVMLVSTLPVGGHHAADCLGSLVVVLASIAIVDRVAGRASQYSRARRALRRSALQPAVL
jgi:membrane-associated phospholipid phosphatase